MRLLPLVLALVSPAGFACASPLSIPVGQPAWSSQATPVSPNIGHYRWDLATQAYLLIGADTDPGVASGSFTVLPGDTVEFIADPPPGQSPGPPGGEFEIQSACGAQPKTLPPVIVTASRAPRFSVAFTRFVVPSTRGVTIVSRPRPPKRVTTNSNLTCADGIEQRRAAANTAINGTPRFPFRTGTYLVKFSPGHNQLWGCTSPTLSECGAIPAGECGPLG